MIATSSSEESAEEKEEEVKLKVKLQKKVVKTKTPPQKEKANGKSGTPKIGIACL